MEEVVKILFNLFSGVLKDFQKAMEYYQNSLKKGYKKALNNIGLLFQNQNQFEKAKEFFELSMKEENNHHAIHNLANLYEKGLGVPVDEDKAIDLFEKSIKMGNHSSMCSIGMLSEKKKNYKKSIEFYEMAIKHGNVNAYHHLGHLYLNGIGVDKNIEKSIEFFELGSKHDHPKCLNDLGKLCILDEDYDTAKIYFERAAKLGDSNAMHNLGFLFEKGFGGEKDIDHAILYYCMADKRNNSNSSNNLGLMHLKGKEIEKDLKKAKEYFEKSIKLGNIQAIQNLGKLYYEEMNFEKSKELLEEAIQLGVQSAIIDLGYLYLEKEEYIKAKECFEKLPNHPKSLLEIGNMFRDGLGVKMDYENAIKCFEKSMSMGNSDAMNQIGYMYDQGLFVNLKVFFRFWCGTKL
jgi:TPR repeat protein